MMYTIVTFLIFSGIFAYVTAFSGFQSSLQDSESGGISSLRIFHSWLAVKNGMYGLINISMGKDEKVFEINDTLPAEKDIQNLLDRYGDFLGQYFSDKTIDVHFEDTSGNKIPLESISPKITLSPMNITYGWDGWGKNEMEIKSPVSSLGYIYAINLTINFVNETIANNSVTWGPYRDCRAKYPCLLLYLNVSDGTKTITSAQTTFDLSRDSKTDQIYCTGGNCWMRISVGSWGGGDPQTVLKIELKDLNISTDTKINLNTSVFYENFPSKLFVGTGFAKKLDNV